MVYWRSAFTSIELTYIETKLFKEKTKNDEFEFFLWIENTLIVEEKSWLTIWHYEETWRIIGNENKSFIFIQLWSEIRTRFLGFAIIVRIKDVRIEVRRRQHKFEKTLKTRTRTTKSLSTEISNCYDCHCSFELFLYN